MEDNIKPFLAYLVLAAAIVILVGWQIIVSVGAHSNLNNALKGRVDAVGRAETTQKSLESFVVDLIQLAERDAGAKEIVEKYQIRKGGNQ
ncbi:MAG: hypothetical protein LBK60_12430 [Verrucomicrobiales bacterium]|jgi:hypothetical protein|nr:hypothetical protein [Verrucomicrobiales bacterium]